MASRPRTAGLAFDLRHVDPGRGGRARPAAPDAVRPPRPDRGVGGAGGALDDPGLLRGRLPLGLAAGLRRDEPLPPPRTAPADERVPTLRGHGAQAPPPPALRARLR